MKKVSLYAGMIIFLLIVGVRGTPIHALEETTVVAGGEVEPMQLTVQPIDEKAMPIVQKVEYTLPFPGMLPDHPLYFLKRFRDTILEKLIADPIRKAEFYILQGDKRLQMGVSLFAAGKPTLGESTVSKAEKYLELAVTGLSSYKKNGGVVPTYVVERLEKSTAKHQEVLTELMSKAGDTEKKGLEGSMQLLKQIIGSFPSIK
jgi:hypothetical protein